MHTHAYDNPEKARGIAMAMGGGSFSPEEIEYLRTLPAVAEVTPTRIIYAEEFKKHCVRELRLSSADLP